jgi:peptidoglycan L-alanyl-D-glutamate endopeptidase CwlK
MSNVDVPDRNRAHLFPAFADKVHLVCADMNDWCKVHWPGHHSTMSEGFRTQARQDWLYAQGRTRPGDIVTWTHNSDHSTGMAADIVGAAGAPSDSGTDNPTWDCPSAFWDYLTHVAHVHGLERIMDYSDQKDLPHIQWPHADTETYAEAKVWVHQQGLA